MPRKTRKTRKTRETTKPPFTSTSSPRRFSDRYTLTVHGDTREQRDSFREFCSSDEITIAVAARETGAHGVHPHLQAYFELAQKARVLKRLKEAFGNNFHVEAARGTREEAISYVYGLGKPYEIGWIVYSKGEYETPPRYSGYAMSFMQSFLEEARPFQRQILEIVQNSARENRTIYWFWERHGGVGKSALGVYLHRMYGALLLTGRRSDMKHAMSRMRELSNIDPPIVVVDLGRESSLGGDLMLGIEEIKNGCFFSGKYESGMIDMKQPVHMIVFANRPPLRGWFSDDRWKVYHIKKDGETRPMGVEQLPKTSEEEQRVEPLEPLSPLPPKYFNPLKH